MPFAKRLNAPYNTVKAIGEKRYKKNTQRTKKTIKCGAKTKDWKKIDDTTLPLVKEAIRVLYGDGNTRPKKITVFAIEKKLGLPSKRISTYLPKCRLEIEKYKETQEEFWAREIVWAAGKIISEGQAFNWKHIRVLTNLRKDNFISCLPYVDELVDSGLAERIRNLL